MEVQEADGPSGNLRIPEARNRAREVQMRRHAPFSFVLLTISSLILAAASPTFAQDVAAEAAPAADSDVAAEAPAPNAWDYPRGVNAGGVRLAMHEPAVLDYVAHEGQRSCAYRSRSRTPSGA